MWQPFYRIQNRTKLIIAVLIMFSVLYCISFIKLTLVSDELFAMYWNREHCKCSVSCVFITYSGSGKWMIDTINHSHPRRLTASLTSSRASITKVPKPRKSVLLYLCSVPCVSRQNINIPRQWWATLWPSDLMSHASRLTTYRVSLHQSPRIKAIWTICQDVSTHD